MISTTTITITRPNTNDVFFYDSQYYIENEHNWLTYYSEAVVNNDIIGVIKTVSPDKLVSTRVFTYSSPEAKTRYCDRFYGAYPDYLTSRSDYCISKNHVLTVVET